MLRKGHAAAILNCMSGLASPAADKPLREALDAVYRKFEAPTPSVICGCPCCLNTRGTDVLLSTPLRRITGKSIWRYVSGAFLTVGDSSDFRYLLPRILEIAATDPVNSNDPEIVLGKLDLANWRSWPADDQRVIEQFVDAWFQLALERDLADDNWIGADAESVMCGAARAGFGLRRWAALLHEPSSTSVLTDLRRRFPSGMSAFWEYAPSGFEELRTILAEGRD